MVPLQPIENTMSENTAGDIRAARRRLAVPALAVSFVFLFSSLLQALIYAAVQNWASALFEKSWFTLAVSSLPMYLIAMPLSVLLFRLIPAETALEKKKIGAPAFMGLLVICFALTYLGNFLGIFLNYLIGVFTGTPPTNHLQEITVSTPLWANFLLVGILAPVFEELFYRKLILDRWRCFGDLPAILLSGILFGLVHGNFYQFFYAAVIGILFGYIYLHTGRLSYTVALHILLNLIGGVFPSEWMKYTAEKPTEWTFSALRQYLIPVFLQFAQVGFMLCCFVAAPIAIFFLHKHVRLNKAAHPLSASAWARAGLLNPAVWLFAFVAVLLFL